MSRYFPSKVDWWFYLVIAAVAGVLGFSAYAVTVIDPQASRSLPALAIPALLALGLPLWLLFSTGYMLDATELRVKSGPFSWKVPLADIRSIKPTRSPLSSPALSLDRLMIEHARGWLMISPEDKDGFLRELDTLRAQLPAAAR